MPYQSPSDFHPYTMQRPRDGLIVLHRTRLPLRVTVSAPAGERIAIAVVLLILVIGGSLVTSIALGGRPGALVAVLMDNMYSIAALGLIGAGLLGAWVRHRRRPRRIELDASRRELRVGSRTMSFEDLNGVYIYPFEAEVDGAKRKAYEVYVRTGRSRVTLGLFDSSEPASQWHEEIRALIAGQDS